jgi:hypothetical protein
MAYPRIAALMDGYNLELDDIRWYLSVLMVDKFAALQPEPGRLIEYVWSGQLSDELFNLEERHLEQLEADWDSGQIDEAKVREFLLEARASRRRRRMRPPE